MKWYRKPPAYTLHLSSKTRTLMKFSLVPHFFIGLYMYSNSTILTPDLINNFIADYINSSNEYFNSYRFNSLHIAIFLSAFAFFLLLFLLRWLGFLLLRPLFLCFRKIKNRFLTPEVASDDFYEELTAL